MAQYDQVVAIIENKRKQARMQQKKGLVAECGNALAALRLQAIPNTHPVNIDLLKRLMKNSVSSQATQEMGATAHTITCTICGGGEYGANEEKHEDGCAGMELARELGWVS